MNRRSFLSALLALVPAAWMPKKAAVAEVFVVETQWREHDGSIWRALGKSTGRRYDYVIYDDLVADARLLTEGDFAMLGKARARDLLKHSAPPGED